MKVSHAPSSESAVLIVEEENYVYVTDAPIAFFCSERTFPTPTFPHTPSHRLRRSALLVDVPAARAYTPFLRPFMRSIKQRFVDPLISYP